MLMQVSIDYNNMNYNAIYWRLLTKIKLYLHYLFSETDMFTYINQINTQNIIRVLASTILCPNKKIYKNFCVN